MRKGYKNKRDFYKAEVQRLITENKIKRQANEVLSKQLQECKKPKEGLSCTIYCSNCQLVYGAKVPNGVSLKASGCAYCGVRDVSYLVRQIK